MLRYLDPRNDLVFKRIFGEHPDILRSFLNALLPLAEDQRIESLEYLSAEQAPVVPLLKHTIVDVRCRDAQGRQFIVEMQMNWTSAFLQRVLFNASQAYVRQLGKGEHFELLQPVIGLSLLDDVFDRASDAYYHHYRLVNVEQPRRVIEGLQLVFIELPKFRPTPELKPEQAAWLRFLRETGDTDTPEAAQRLRREVAVVPAIEQALELAGAAAFSRGELEAYDRYWDAVRVERTLLTGKYAEGRAEGRTEGRAEGRTEGQAEGRAEAFREAVKRLMERGSTEAEAKALLGLS